jgi:hypothetical protein
MLTNEKIAIYKIHFCILDNHANGFTSLFASYKHMIAHDYK